MKRILSLILAICLTAMALPPPAHAEAPPAPDLDSQVTVESTNDFGELLSGLLEEAQEEQAEETKIGYSVTDLTFSGTMATVAYETLEEANLVVGVYTEDGTQLLASGNATVTPEATTAMVTIEGEMPAYFLAKAFLLDTYDFSPLSSEYATPLYTQEMQELLASTADDYEADRVLTLSDDRTTNFAVYAEGTRRIDAAEGVNVLTGNGDGSYTVTNADENFTTLTVGDVFSYTYANGEVLIAKVAAITVDGTTVTITEDENIEMSDVFSQVKVEAEPKAEDFTYDPTGADPALTYRLSTQQFEARTFSNQNRERETAVTTYSCHFDLAEKKIEDESGASVTVSGTLDISLGMELEYYKTEGQQYLEFTLTNSNSFVFSLAGKLRGTIPLGEFNVTPVIGVFIGIAPSVILETEAAIDAKVSASVSVGFSYLEGSGFTNTSESPKFEPEIGVQGTLFIGLDLSPRIFIINKNLLSAGSSMEVGFEATGTVSSKDDSDEMRHHLCERCLDGEVNSTMRMKPYVKILFGDPFEVLLVNCKSLLCYFYYSFDNNEFGVGKCPYCAYRLTVETLNALGEPLAGVQVSVGEQTIESNDNGVAVFYLVNGTYTVSTVWPNESTNTKKITISAAAQKLQLKYRSEQEGTTQDDLKDNIFATVDDVVILEGILAEGSCGENVTWTLYTNGTMKIEGHGPMDDYDYRITTSLYSSAPWWEDYREKIQKVVIGENVTTVGNGAFLYCDNIREVEFPDSLVRIGKYAFQRFNSGKWETVDLPANLKEIDDSAFGNSDFLAITLPEGLEKMGNGVFDGSKKLREVTIRNGVKEMGVSVFRGCISLTRVVLPSGITEIPNNTFDYCPNLKEVVIPDTVTRIGSWAFYQCEELEEIVIPDGVTQIGFNAFGSCASLRNIVIPDSVASLADEYGAAVFAGCTSLESVTLSKNLETIGNDTFRYCESLKTVEIPDCVQGIGQYAFSDCLALENVKIGKGVESIGYGAFSGCENLKGVVIPASVKKMSQHVFSGDVECLWFEGNLPDVTTPQFGNNDQVTIYYPADNPTWTEDAVQGFGGTVTLLPYTLDENGNKIPVGQAQVEIYISTPETALQKSVENTSAREQKTDANIPPDTAQEVWTGEQSAQPSEESISIPATQAAIGGEYGVTEKGAKTASFTGLQPGGEYVLLALVSVDTATPLAADNLLYITQGVADESGSLQFVYIPRVVTDASYVIACGSSTKDLANAEVRVPTMYANGAVQSVRLTVVYDGKTLTEGIDYVLAGQVSATNPGDYVCVIRGIYNYTGAMNVTYTIKPSPEITSDRYKIADGFLYLPTETMAETLLTGLNGTNIRITGSDEAMLEDAAMVGTGAMLAQGDGKVELTIVLYGDLDGSGRINTSDLLQLRRALLGIIDLEGAQQKAATAVTAGEAPGTADLLQLRRVLLGIADSMQPAAWLRTIRPQPGKHPPC